MIMSGRVPHRRRPWDLLPRRADFTAMRVAPRADLFAGVTVAVVALPLALGFGAAAGMSPIAGLTTSVIAGLIAAIFGGSDLQVSGPTGAMTVILIPIAAQHGPAGIGTVGLIAGGILVVLALLRAGRYMAYVPVPVIEGFTLGIAITIFLQQLPAATGTDSDARHVLAATGDVLSTMLHSPQWSNLGLAATVVVVMLLGRRWWPAFPASLVAITLTTAFTWTAGISVPCIGQLPSVLPAPGFGFVSGGNVAALLPAACGVAILAALESLLCARVADTMSGDRPHHPDRVLWGQGLANLAVPAFGGIPAAAVIARTAVNVRSGARSRMAAIWHALVLAAFLLLAAPVVEQIPLAVLAGVLLATSISMINHADLTALVRATRTDGLVMVLTTVTTVALDLIMGIVVGLAVAAVALLVKVSASLRLAVDQATLDEHLAAEPGLREHVSLLRMYGPLVFASGRHVLERAAPPPTASVVVLQLGGLTMVDASGAMALRDFIERLQRYGAAVFVCGLPSQHRRTLTRLGALSGTAEHATTANALTAARDHLRAAGTR